MAKCKMTNVDVHVNSVSLSAASYDTAGVALILLAMTTGATSWECSGPILFWGIP